MNSNPPVLYCLRRGARVQADVLKAPQDTNRELVFAVAHVSEMLTALKSRLIITPLGTVKSSGMPPMKRRRRSHRTRNRQRMWTHRRRLSR